MITEVERLVADWLTDDTDGVNALLATTPADGSDPTPVDIATVTTEADDGEVARGALPLTLPAVAVSVDQIKDMDGSSVTITGDGLVRLRIRIGVADSLTAHAVRDLSHYLRVTKRSFRRFLRGDANARVRNDVYLENCASMAEQISPTKDEVAGTIVLSGYLIADVTVRDLLD